VRSLGREYPRVNLLRHPENRGKGEAVRSGINNAVGQYVLFLDSDLATHPREVIKFIPHCADNRLIIGSRELENSKILKKQPWYRVVIGKILNFFVRKTMSLPYRDTQCGFKMFARETGKSLFRETPPSRWLFDVDLIVRARANGLEIVELPVNWEHRNNSKISFLEVLRELPRMWKLRRITKQ
jgi:dolichyl-phosphate beta-glucosyltransferase